jgi:hypothetical protein
MARLLVSDEVRALLPTAALERVLAAREHTEIICGTCRLTIAPEDQAVVSVSVAIDRPAERSAVLLAHATCQPSVVHEVTWPADHVDDRFSYWVALRAHPIPCILIWEPVSLHIDAEAGQALNVSFYTSKGFQASEHGMALSDGPPLPGWVLRSSGKDLVLDSPTEEAERFSGVNDGDPERVAWLQHAKHSRRCLLIVGESLGLDRIDAERIDALLAVGRAVATVVLAEITD